MYTSKNYKSKKDLKADVAAGKEVTIFAPGLGTPKTDGVEYISGPHFPAAHSWYAQVTMKDGKVIKVK